MRVGPLEQGEGGGRRKSNFGAWRAREDTAQSKPLAQLCDRQSSLGPPQLRIRLDSCLHVPLFLFPEGPRGCELSVPLYSHPPHIASPWSFGVPLLKHSGCDTGLLNTSLPPASEEASQAHFPGPAWHQSQCLINMGGLKDGFQGSSI